MTNIAELPDLLYDAVTAPVGEASGVPQRHPAHDQRAADVRRAMARPADPEGNEFCLTEPAPLGSPH
jgi:hypothetical protein